MTQLQPANNPASESSACPRVSPGQENTAQASRDAAEWFTAHEKTLYRYAQSLTHHRETAKDAVQDTFVKLCQQDLTTIQNPKAWLYTVCRRRCYDINRAANNRRRAAGSPEDMQTLTPPEAQPDQQIERHEEQDRAMALLEKLPELQREALRLKLQAGLSYKEIAEVLDKSVSHIGVLIHEALKKLRQQMTTDA